MAEFRNYMQELLAHVLGEILAGQEKMCKCERCRLDIVALALDNLSPKYVTGEVGSADTKLQAEMMKFQVDVVKELSNAIKKVRSRPRHDKV